MSTIGLVHGGGFGAWCWELLIPELEARGRRAVAVDLTPDVLAGGAARCATAVCRAFAEIEDLVLVGHSIAGLVIPLVGATRTVRRMIFLHALLPRPGQSVADQVASEPDMFNPEVFSAAAPFWEDEGVALHFLFHDSLPEVARAAFTRLRPEPGILGQEVTPLQVWPDTPRAYIVCTEDRIASPAWARRAARERLGVEPVAISSGHCPFLSRPRQLADVLDSCSRG